MNERKQQEKLLMGFVASLVVASLLLWIGRTWREGVIALVVLSIVFASIQGGGENGERKE